MCSGGSISCDRKRRSYWPKALGGYIPRPGDGARCLAICSCHIVSRSVGPSSSDGDEEAVRHQERRGANPLWIRMPMQKSENSRFVDEECCSVMGSERETAMAASACVARLIPIDSG